MSNYIKNDICKFKILTPFDVSIKKTLLVTSLFKLHSGGYKNFQKYVDGITFLNKNAEKEDMYVRLFIDKTITEDETIMSKLRKHSRVQLVEYYCGDFIIDQHHVGLFGTLVRFFPLFDFEYNDADVVIMCDADARPGSLVFAGIMKLYNVINTPEYKKNIYLASAGMYFHYQSNSISIDENRYMLPYIYANSIVGLNRIPKESFVAYFNKLRKYIDNPPEKIYSTYNIKPDKYKILCENNICYGVDEYYINKKLFKYMLTKKLPLCFHYTYSIYDMFRKVVWYRQSTDNLRKKIVTYYFSSNNLFMYSKKSFEKQLSPLKVKGEITKDMIEFKKKMLSFLNDLFYKKKDFRLYDKSIFYLYNKIDHNKYYSIEQIEFFNYKKDPVILNTIIC